MFAPPPGTQLLRELEVDIDFGLEFTSETLDPDEAIVSLVSLTCQVSTEPPFADQWTSDNGRIQGNTISGQVNGATTATAGSGYTPNSTLTLTVGAPPPGGTTAQLTASVGSAGTVVGDPTVVDGGEGYLSAPALTYPSPGGSGTAATGSTSILKRTLSVSVGDGTQQQGEWRMIIAVVQTNQGRRRQSDSLILYTPDPSQDVAS